MSTSNKTTILQHNERLSVLVDTVENLPDAEEITLESLEVTKNGTYTPDDGVDGFDEVIVSIPTAAQATTIKVNDDGLITATTTQQTGYVTGGTKTATKQLTTQGAKTITPSTLDQIAISQGVYATGNVTVQGDSNLVAENIIKGKTIFGVAGAAETGGGGGDTSMEDALIERTTTNYTNNRVTTIGDYAFYSCTRLTTVNFPVCTSIGNNAFYSCSNLTTISFPVCTSIDSNAFAYCSSLTIASFPKCTTIGNSAFYSCVKLTTANFPKCTRIGNYAFYSCVRLTTVSFPVCTSIGNNAFARCSSLTTANFPKCTTIGIDAFAYCSSLTTASFPVCTSIGNSAFYDCINLTTISFPACTRIGNVAFRNCSNLTSVSFPVCTSIGSNAFYSCINLTTVNFPVCTSISSNAFVFCYKLLSLYLNASSVCTLANSGAFHSTPIAGYTTSTNGVYGSIFVPASLVDAYKAATNWTYFADRITAIPE